MGEIKTASDFALTFAGKKVIYNPSRGLRDDKGYVHGWRKIAGVTPVDVLVGVPWGKPVSEDPIDHLVPVVANPVHGYWRTFERLIALNPGLLETVRLGSAFPHRCPCGCGVSCYVGFSDLEYPEGVRCTGPR